MAYVLGNEGVLSIDERAKGIEKDWEMRRWTVFSSFYV